jgi:hypothetical protein
VAADVHHRVEYVADHAIAVDHIGDPAGYHGQCGRNAVKLAHRAALVAEQRERQLVLARESGMLVHGIRTHPDHRGSGISKCLVAVTEGARLGRTAAGVVLGIEVKNNNV